jgi:hypothetical protein
VSRRSERPRPRKGWFGADEEARVARGLHPRIGMHLADAQLHTASEALKFRVMPVFKASAAFTIDGDSHEALELARPLILSDRNALFYERDICSMFQMIVAELFYYRSSYRYIQLSETQPAVLELLESLPPETVYAFKRRGKVAIEQYVRPRPPYGETSFQFEPNELLQLSWPLQEPGGPASPYRAALRVGQAEDRLMDRSMLGMEAFNEQGETFITFAQARLGKYSGALAATKRIDARVRNLLYDVPGEPTTQYFEIDRIIRCQVAACDFRSYLIDEFNRQVLQRWADANSWGLLRLRYLPPVLTANDWRDVWASFQDHSLSYGDIVELLRADREASAR